MAILIILFKKIQEKRWLEKFFYDKQRKYNFFFRNINFLFYCVFSNVFIKVVIPFLKNFEKTNKHWNKVV